MKCKDTTCKMPTDNFFKLPTLLSKGKKAT